MSASITHGHTFSMKTKTQFTMISRILGILMMTVRMAIFLCIFAPIAVLLLILEHTGDLLQEVALVMSCRWERFCEEWLFLTNGNQWRTAKAQAKELHDLQEVRRLFPEEDT